jgi:hypothetical protein
MLKPEIQYWLLEGKTIFRHSTRYWMRLFAENGSRVMISVPADELQLVNPRMYTRTKDVYVGKTMEQLKKENGWTW